ncbi:ComF family protein [Kocuria sp.]|uniref:ComF family protein n=1 Tax=Kocuria sp. TaxID=1871328 RepID=UPI0026DFE83E|nr:phosphoribosyltransferase family protein [Kocuria sp.]MDO5619581.1 phosphoribosyltransferase family protein [Kocuria sp.]
MNQPGFTPPEHPSPLDSRLLPSSSTWSSSNSSPGLWWGREADRWAACAWDLVGEALEPVLPVECAVCRAPGTALCRSCRRLLHRCTARPRRVEAHARHAHGLPIVATGAYEHELATCLLAFKQAGRTDLTQHLARILNRALHASVGSNPSEGNQRIELVPVPSSAAALRRRWFDPVGVLLKAALAQDHSQAVTPLGLHAVPWLVHTSTDLAGMWHRVKSTFSGRDGQPQKLKTADQRSLAGPAPFRVAKGRRGRSGSALQPGRVILVDDVVTTGATLHRARSTLEGAGAVVVGAVVLAAAHTPTGNTR